MSNRQHGRPALAPVRPRPIEQLHPVLLHLIVRMDVMPPGDGASITETGLAHAVSLAISMLPDDEQAYMVSRIMTDDEIAEERLNSPQVQDLRRRVLLSADERRLLMRASPEPEDDQDEGGANPCVVCSARSDLSVPCGCHYCAHCLRESIRTGLRSEMDFPPRCCRPLDEATIRRAQRPALVHLFRQLSAEYAVPAESRLYCHDPGCSSFIPPSAIQAAARDENDATAVGTCPSCGTETCAACGSRSHRGLPCREEYDEEALLDMMDGQGLVSCPACGIVVALTDGCNHMTCVCHVEFCYLCGLEWRTCSCPLYNSFHLRVPVRQRPGRRPITRGGRAHLADGTGGMARIPQLRYDPEDEIALAVVDYDAPAGASAPATARNPAPAHLPEPILRHNRLDHMEVPLHRGIRRPPQPQHHVAAVQPPARYGGAVRPLPFPLHPDGHHPLRHPPRELLQPQPMAGGMPGGLRQALEQLRIGEGVLQNHYAAYMRQRATIMEQVARGVQQILEHPLARERREREEREERERGWGNPRGHRRRRR